MTTQLFYSIVQQRHPIIPTSIHRLYTYSCEKKIAATNYNLYFNIFFVITHENAKVWQRTVGYIGKNKFGNIS